MVKVKNSPLFHVFILGNIALENLFNHILKGKTPFKAIKTRSSKSQKIDISPKELTDDFGPKMAILPTFFFFRQYRPGKCLLRYSSRKKSLFRL